MASTWYYAQGGQQFGPVSSRQLKRLAAGGQLRPTDLIWKDGIADWTPALKLKGLFRAAEQVNGPSTPDVVVKPLTPEKAADVSPFDLGPDAEVVRPGTNRSRAGTDLDAVAAALQSLATDPVGGLRSAFDLLGPSRALVLGLAFGLTFVVLLDLGSYLMIRHFVHGFGELAAAGPTDAPPGGVQAGPPTAAAVDIPIKVLLRLTLVGVILFVSIALGSLICRRVFQGQGSVPGDVFVAGVSLLPVGAAVSLAALLERASTQVAVALLVLALCLNVLVLYAGCVKVHQLSERASTCAVPAIIVLSNWIASLTLRVLM